MHQKANKRNSFFVLEKKIIIFKTISTWGLSFECSGLAAQDWPNAISWSVYPSHSLYHHAFSNRCSPLPGICDKQNMPCMCYCCRESNCLHKPNSNQGRACVWESQNWVINNHGLQGRKISSDGFLQSCALFAGFFFSIPVLCCFPKCCVDQHCILQNCVWHLTWICFSQLGSDILIWKLCLYIQTVVSA